MSVPTVAWWTVAVLAGGLLVERVATDLAELSRRARAGGPPVEVVVARVDLELGAPITAADVTTVHVPSDLVPSDALTGLDGAMGTVAAVAVLADTVLTARHLIDADRTDTAAVVGPNQRLVRVVVEGGVQPEPGDVIDLLAPQGPSDAFGGGSSDDTPRAARLVLRGAVVVAIDDDPDGAQWDDGHDRRGVSLLTSPAEAARLVGAASAQPLVAILAPPESARDHP